MSFIVAVDGPSGTGKGTITKLVSEKFGFQYLDTGAMYRCVTLKLLNEKIDIEDIEKIEKILKDIKLELDGDKIYLDGKDVSKRIREEDVTNQVSQVSHIPIVRTSMVELQRRMSEGKSVILDGRDIGTNVFPNAEVKIYLDASTEERAKRRFKQNQEKGIDIPFEEVKANIEFRDNNDKSSKVGTLKKAEDAFYIDTTNLNIKQVEKQVEKIIKKKQKQLKKIENAYVMTKENGFKKFMRGFVKGFLGLLYRIVYRPKVVGLENFPKDEGFIICSKHINYLDAAGIILLNKKPIRFIAKADLYRFGVLSWLGHLFNIIPVKRDSGDINSVKLCLKALKNKEVLGIFPEGTRKGLEKHMKVKNGAVFLAEKAKVKIVPVGIQGTFKPFTKVTFNYGKPIDVHSFKSDDPDWLDKASEKVMDDIIMLTKEKV